MESAVSAPTEIEFGRFRVLPLRRVVLADNRPLELGGRAFDVLVTLIEARGATVSKDALMQRVWPNRIVEENNLQAQISALRRVFGADRDLIRTIAGRGYQFTGAVRTALSSAPAQASAETAAPASDLATTLTNLPAPVSGLIGRDGELEEIQDLTSRHRIITLTGVGGIGKTRLALEAARCLLPNFRDGVWIIELAPLSDPALVPITVATALGLEPASGAASPGAVAHALRTKQLMLVLDNCEHVVDAAARMAEELLHANPAARVIATSREPLRAEGEWIYRVPPLAVPTDSGPDSDDPLRYGAVALFVERARSAAPHFSFDAQIAATIAEICRRLDGIPLAIELAAARATTLGIEGVAARVGDRFRLLAGGRRTAMPRHQTLRATLDWSYELLTEPERTVLRRLAIFPGGFSLQAATAVAEDARMTASTVVEYVASLVAKSLLTADAGGPRIRYLLLETTRAYLLEKLVEGGEFDAAARRHAEYHLALLERAAAEAETRPTDEWLAEYGPRIDNVRAALDWAFSDSGDLSIGIALTVACVPLWLQLSLMEECRARVERTLDSISRGSDRPHHCEMDLYAALGASLMYSKGPVPEAGAAWTRALELAESLGDVSVQLAALWGLSFYRSVSAAHRAELAHAQKFRSLAAIQMNPAEMRVGDRMIGTALHYLGDQVNARPHIERVLAYNTPSVDRVRSYRFQFDQASAARCVLSHILWLQGFPDQAVRTAQASVNGAQATGHALSLCNALAQAACPTAQLVGDLRSAEHFVAMLIEHSERHALPVWQAWGRCWKGALLLKRGELVTGLPLLQAALEELLNTGFVLRYAGFLGVFAQGLGRAGHVAQGLTTIGDAIARTVDDQGYWCMPELLRVKGELLLLEDARNAEADAEDHFQQALTQAREQGTLGWELRVAMSLARLWHRQARSEEALALLAPVYGRFTEGFTTTDLITARALLDDF